MVHRFTFLAALIWSALMGERVFNSLHKPMVHTGSLLTSASGLNPKSRRVDR